MSRSFVDAFRIIAVNNVSIATTSTAGATTAFSAQTRAIRVCAPGLFNIKIGDGTPTANSADCFVPPNWESKFVVTPGQKASVFSPSIQTVSIVEVE